MDIQLFSKVVEPYSAVFLDSYGVLKNHHGIIPGATHVISQLKKQGKQVRVLTNDASRSQKEQLRSFERMGVTDLEASEIITSGMMAKQYLENKCKNGIAAYLGTEAAANYIIEAHVEARAVSDVTQEHYNDISVMVFLDDEGFDWCQDINKTINLLRKTNIPAIVANSDKLYPVAANDVAIATGGIAQLVESILGREFIHFGKPDSQMFFYAFDDINLKGSYDRNDILMVGDTLHTDILGGNKFGLDTVLVLTGNTTKSKALGLSHSLGVVPDYICESIIT